MKYVSPKSFLLIALAVNLFCSVAWSDKSHACASDPYISGICIMASIRSGGFGNGYYVLADGTTEQIAQYQALFSLIGVTYGGNGSTNFQLPDLRGRVVIGAGKGAGLPLFRVGDKGGAINVTLTSAQMPLHTHPLTTGPGNVTVTTGVGTLTGSTTATGLTATTTIGTLSANTTLSGLTATLKASSGAAAVGSPLGASLPTYAGSSKFYASTAPDTAMNAGCVIVGGTASTTLSGSPTTTISGTAATTLSGSPSVTIGGQTGQSGTGTPAAVPTLSPYLAMYYYIAVNGYYPPYD